MLVKAIEVATSAEAVEKSAQQLRGVEQLRVSQVFSPSVSAQACFRCGGAGQNSQCAITVIRRATWLVRVVHHVRHPPTSPLVEAETGAGEC